MHTNSSFHRLFSISVLQFSIFILFFHHSTQVHSALTFSLTHSSYSSKTAQATGWVKKILHGDVSYIADLKKSISNIVSYYSDVDFSEPPEETTVGTTETADVSDDLPERTTELPVEVTTQQNEVTNGSSSTTVVPGVVDPGEEEDIYWYERPEGYVTLAVIGAVTLVGIVSAVVFICKNKLAIQAAQKAMPSTPYA